MSTNSATVFKWTDCTHCFAVPGQGNIIDMAHPVTGLSVHYNQTLDQVRERHPGAELVNFADWRAARAAEQDALIVWTETTAEQYDDMLDILPPAFWQRGLFLVGEPADHHAVSGKARFTAYRRFQGRYFVASRPMTRDEAAAIVNTPSVAAHANPAR